MTSRKVGNGGSPSGGSASIVAVRITGGSKVTPTLRVPGGKGPIPRLNCCALKCCDRVMFLGTTPTAASITASGTNPISPIEPWLGTESA